MAKTVGDYQIPFDADGNQQHYPESSWRGDPSLGQRERVGPDWRPNDPFEDTLTYVGFSRGRSAAYFNFKRADGKSVTVFLKEMDEMLPHMVNGKVSGVFRFVKRGENYGCTMMQEGTV